jgi:YihY family inner membrane protein
MNPIERAVRRVDRMQQRHTPLAFVFGVVKKYGDDNGGVLVANLSYSAFVSLFPLLLILATILGLVAASNPAFRDHALSTVASQFPVIGQQLTSNVGALRRSSIIGLIVGLLFLVWGAAGLAQAGLFTMAQVWNLPGPARPGYVQRLGRAVAFLSLLGAGVVVTTLLASLNTYGGTVLGGLGGFGSFLLVVLAELAAAIVNSGMYLAAFRVLTPKGVPARRLLPGAVVGGIGWTVLQVLGTYLVHHFLRNASAYHIFAAVLGLLAWINLAVQITVYAAEINVVLTRRMWPRSIVQPPLTEADRASMAMQALQNQRREEQHIKVSFDDRGSGASASNRTPQTPEEVAPPAQAPVREQRGSPDAGGPEADGAEADGAEADGAEADGAEADGAEADGAEADGAARGADTAE